MFNVSHHLSSLRRWRAFNEMRCNAIHQYSDDVQQPCYYKTSHIFIIIIIIILIIIVSSSGTSLWAPVAIYLSVKHRGTWGPLATFLPHFYYTYKSPEVSTYFEWQLMLGGPVANMLPHFSKYADALRPSGKTVATYGFWLTSAGKYLPQTNKNSTFLSHLSLTHP